MNGHHDPPEPVAPPTQPPAKPDDALQSVLPAGKPSPATLYKQTGGGQAYIDVMRAHGYLITRSRG